MLSESLASSENAGTVWIDMVQGPADDNVNSMILVDTAGDAQKTVRAVFFPSSIGLILIGIAVLVKGIATWDGGGLASDRAIGNGISGIALGEIIFAFPAIGGKIR